MAAVFSCSKNAYNYIHAILSCDTSSMYLYINLKFVTQKCMEYVKKMFFSLGGANF